MTSKTRLTVLLVSTPIIVLVLLGGFLNRVMAGQDTSYQHLRVFEDVVSLVVNNYVEKVNNENIMRGALRGLAEGLDADSAWLNPAEAGAAARGQAAAKGSVGLEITRQYYLRVIAARDGSPAAKAGLTTGDYIRAINGTPTREMSAKTSASANGASATMLGRRPIHAASARSTSASDTAQTSHWVWVMSTSGASAARRSESIA